MSMRPGNGHAADETGFRATCRVIVRREAQATAWDLKHAENKGLRTFTSSPPVTAHMSMFTAFAGFYMQSPLPNLVSS